MDNPGYSSKKTIITASVLFVVDAFILNQGAIAAILLLLIVLWWLPKSGFLKLRRQSPKIQLTKSLIYGVMAICVFGANTINNKIAKDRAEQLIPVIEQYHKANGKYPAQLSDLVPTYIPKVPAAKYTLVFANFHYYNRNENASLFYVAMPPFGRPTYSFNDKKWGYID